MTQDNTEHLSEETKQRLQASLQRLVEDSNRHDAEQAKQKNILGMIRQRSRENLLHTCETIVRRQEEISRLINDLIGGSMLNPDEWDCLEDTVDEMDLLMRRLDRQIGFLK